MYRLTDYYIGLNNEVNDSLLAYTKVELIMFYKF